MSHDIGKDDFVEIVDEHEHTDACDEGDGPWSHGMPPWRLLIVDDEEDVHHAAKYALSDIQFEDRSIEFLHAFSSEEGAQILAHEADVACVLLDVVMETETAGLDLVKHVRETLRNDEVRIILRTGQPGYAPESEVVQKYEINDYKIKSELTASGMHAAVCNAFRSYRQIRSLNDNRRGLQLIIESSSDLLAEKAVQKFAEGVIIQIASMVGAQPEGLFLLKSRSGEHHEAQILAAVGPMRKMIGTSVTQLPDRSLREVLLTTLESRTHYISHDRLVLHIDTHSDDAILVHLGQSRPLSELDLQLLEVFAANIGVGFENSRMFEAIQFLAYKDPVCGLANRNGLLTEADELIQQGAQFAIASVGLDGFHRFNDALGEETGNAILVAFAEELKQIVPPTTLLARIQHDSFGLLDRDAGRLLRTVDVLVERFRNFLKVGQQHLPIRTTIGVAVYPDHGETSRILLSRAGSTVRHANDQGARGRVHVFDMDEDARLQRNIALVAGAQDALSNGELSLVYQPKHQMADGRLIGCEALIRWRRSDGEAVSPAEFIPAFEASGDIIPVGQWVLSRVAEQIAEAHLNGIYVPPIAVNVSPLQLRDESFEEHLSAILRDRDIGPDGLQLEITESVFVGGSEAVIDQLFRLRGKGFTLALDDFGTGYSALSYIRQLPIKQLKIDRSFVKDIVSDERGASLVRSILRMCEELELETVAEGVETEAQLSLLRDWGCQVGQGYFFSRPLPFDEAIGQRRSAPADPA